MHPSSQPKHANVSRLLRRALRAQECGELGSAERLFRKVLSEQPRCFEALHGLGLLYQRRGRLDMALSLIQDALRNHPNRADGFASLGLIFHLLRQFERAVVAYDEGLRLAPEDSELLGRRGVALLELGRPEAALDDFDRALASNPEHCDVLGNRGNALLRLNRPIEAIESYDRALIRAPDNAALWTNRAIALRRLDRPHEALMSTARALAAQPNFAPARFVDGSVRLALGDFAAGWRGYEARWGGALAAQRRKLPAPLWLGQEPLDGKTILLHAEQGLGDTIHFVRYAPLVAARGARVVLEVQPPLLRLLSGLRGIAAVMPRGVQLPHFDYHCPLASLPLAFNTVLQTIPADVPYVTPPPEQAALWRTRLSRPGPLLVGLAWAGEPAHDNDINRSLRLAALAPLLGVPEVRFVSLQHRMREEETARLRALANVLPLGEAFRDFADTAAVVAALDLVISVDTAVAHLTGAMGKPLWLLLPFAADFRWLRARTDSPWYPMARLFRQTRFAGWPEVIDTVAAQLAHLARYGAGQREASAEVGRHSAALHRELA